MEYSFILHCAEVSSLFVCFKTVWKWGLSFYQVCDLFTRFFLFRRYFMTRDTQICSGKSFVDRCLLAKFLRSLFMKHDWHCLWAPELSVLLFCLLPSSQITTQEMISRDHPLSIFHSQTFLQGFCYHPEVRYVEDSTFYSITNRNSCFSSFRPIIIEEVELSLWFICAWTARSLSLFIW